MDVNPMLAFPSIDDFNRAMVDVLTQPQDVRWTGISKATPATASELFVIRNTWADSWLRLARARQGSE